MRSFRVIFAGLLVAMLSYLPSPAPADSPCIVRVQGQQATIICSGISVGTVKLPVVEVTQTLPPVPEVTKTIKIPGPTKTVTELPGLITVTKGPVPNKTVTIQPQPTSLPTPTIEMAPRQPTPTHDTLGPATPFVSSHPHLIDFGDGHTTVIEATLGLLATVLLIAGFFATLYAGYWLGFREADSENASFMRAVLDKAKTNNR